MKTKNIILTENQLKLLIEKYVNGFWGKAGAGILPLCSETDRVLLAKRSAFVEEPGTWGTWGGAIDKKENPKDAAVREFREETNFKGEMNLIPLYQFNHESGFTYYNYLGVVREEFKPRLNWETERFGWFDVYNLPNNLHFGIKNILNDQSAMNLINKHIS